MEIKLENITETCAKKILAMRMVCPNLDQEKCRYCKPQDYEDCDKYFPVGRTQLPIRRGYYAITEYFEVQGDL